MAIVCGKDSWRRHFCFVICAPPPLYFTLSAIVLWQFGSNIGIFLCVLRALSFPLRDLATCNVATSVLQDRGDLATHVGSPRTPVLVASSSATCNRCVAGSAGAKNAKGKVLPASFLSDVPEILATHHRYLLLA